MPDQDTIRDSDDLRRDWAIQRITDYVNVILSSTPELNSEQRSHLVELFRSGGQS